MNLKRFSLVLSFLFLFFIPFSNALNINTISEKFGDEGVIIDPDSITNGTYYSNQTDYWGPYYFTLFNEYASWLSGDGIEEPWFESVNTSWIFSPHTDGGIDMTGDPWYFSGVHYEFDGNVSADGNITSAERICDSTGCIGGTSTTYYPSISAVTGGSYTDTSDITDAWYYDTPSLNFSEGGGAAPLDIYFNFTAVDDFSQLVIREYYVGSASHHIQIQIWDYDSSSWEDYFEFVGQNGYTVLTIPAYDSADHIDPVDNNVTIRLHQIQNGVSSHRLYTDFIWLIDGGNVGSSTNLDGYAKYLFGYNNFAGNGSFRTSSTVCDSNGCINDLWTNNSGEITTDSNVSIIVPSDSNMNLLLQTEVNYNTCLLFREGGYSLGFNICNEALKNNLQFSNGTGTVLMQMNRGTGLVNISRDLSVERTGTFDGGLIIDNTTQSVLSWKEGGVMRGSLFYTTASNVFGFGSYGPAGGWKGYKFFWDQDDGTIILNNVTNVSGGLDIDGIFTSDDFSLSENATDVILDSGGTKGWCIGNCL